MPGNIGLRASYIGMRTDDLVWGPNMNDMSYSSTAKAKDRPLTDRPFPNWGTVNSRSNGANAFFNAMQIEARGHAARLDLPVNLYLGEKSSGQ